MDRTSAPGNVNGLFFDGDPGAGQPASVLDSAWCNGVQEELIQLIEETGGIPDPLKLDQIRVSLRRFASRNNMIFNANLFHHASIPLGLSFPIGPSGARLVADAWNLIPDGVTITGLTRTGGGIKIEGSGPSGSAFSLLPIASNAYSMPRAVFPGVGEVSRMQLSGGFRAYSLGVDASIAVELSAAPYSTFVTAVSPDIIEETKGTIGGLSDVASMGFCSFEFDNRSDKALTGYTIGPVCRFELKANGAFVVYFVGAGLYESLFSSVHFPRVVYSDYVRDRAHAEIVYNPDKYDQIVNLHNVYGLAGGGPTFTDFDYFIPWRVVLADTSPQVENVEVINIVGLTIADGGAGTANWTATSYTINSIDEYGISINFHGDHASIARGGAGNRCKLTSATIRYRQFYMPS
jgi:hypothetical protein